MGKFLGLALTMVVQIALMAICFAAVLEIQGGEIGAGILTALLLIFVETILVISMALFFTSFSRPFLSGLFCLGIFAAGRNADLVSQLAQRKSLEWLAPALDAVGAVLPNLHLFYPSGKMVDGAWATVRDQFVSTGYVLDATAYGLAYTAAFLVFSMLLLGRRDFV